MNSDFFTDFTASIAEIDWTALIAIGGISLVLGVIEFWAWANGGNLPFPDIWLTPFVLAYFVPQYLAVMSILSQPVTLTGCLRFLIANLLAHSPLLAGLGLILADRVPWIGLSLVFLGIVTGTLLMAWPSAQALSSTAISPIKVLKATKGHRWKLVMGICVISAVSQIDLSAGPLSSSTGAAFRALVSSVLSAIGLALTAGLTATALRYAVKNDATLYGGQAKFAH